ncbi:MAG: GWxTD domain-containing protein [Gemmatimonadaceae bacterium]
MVRAPLLALLAFSATAACSSSNKRSGPAGNPNNPNNAPFLSGNAPDLNRVYQSMGLISANGQMPFVGSVSFMATPKADTTLMLLAVSLPAAVLNFQRNNEQYAATYTVRLELRKGLAVVQTWDARETVRVPTFKETTRTDESVIWQQYLRLPPGEYAMTVGFKDANSVRGSATEVALVVPRLSSGTLSTPLPVYEAISRHKLDSLPRVLARPRSSVSFSGDTVLPVYVESTGLTGPSPVTATLVAEGNTVVWRDTAVFDPQGGTVASKTFLIPVRKMGIGVVTLNMARPGSADTSSTRLFVSLGDDLPIASFEEMLRYLKYFATTDKLRPLRDATSAARPQAWADFLRATDPVPGTAENEALRDYFNRIRAANVRFRDDAILGWTSDRGIAFVGLGEPEQIFVSQSIDSRQRQEIWEYQGDTRLRLVFLDNGGMGRFRLSSQQLIELEAAIRRKLSQQQR